MMITELKEAIVFENEQKEKAATLKKTKGWKNLKFKEFEEQLEVYKGIRFDIEKVEPIVRKHFGKDQTSYHEYMIRILKGQVDPNSEDKIPELEEAVVSNQNIEKMYGMYIIHILKEIREEIQGDWVSTYDDKEYCLFKGFKMNIGTKEGEYYYYVYSVDKKDSDKNFNSLWEGKLYRTLDEARFYAEKYINVLIKNNECLNKKQ